VSAVAGNDPQMIDWIYENWNDYQVARQYGIKVYGEIGTDTSD
jgi:hypothetical protein